MTTEMEVSTASLTERRRAAMTAIRGLAPGLSVCINAVEDDVHTVCLTGKERLPSHFDLAAIRLDGRLGPSAVVSADCIVATGDIVNLAAMLTDHRFVPRPLAV